MTNRAKMLAVIGLALFVGAVTVWAQMGGGPGQGPGGPGMMSGSGMGMGCPGAGGMMGMGGTRGPSGPGLPVTTIEQAATVGQNYLRSWNLPNAPELALQEIMEFSNCFYVSVKEKSTGAGAIELLIERFSGQVQFEPTIMWNTKYGGGPGQGPMGGPRGPVQPLTITVEQARQAAQQFLNLYFPGAALAKDATAFYGYYTIDLLRDGKIFGMLSVHGATAQVWYHSWHGSFLASKEF